MSDFLEEQIKYFSKQCNVLLHNDPDLPSLPLNECGDIFKVSSEGVFLCKLINKAKPSTVSRFKVKPKNTYEVIENHNEAIDGAIKIGCKVVNITPMNLLEGKVHAVLGLVWQILRIHLTHNLTIENRPEMLNLKGDDQDLGSFLKQTPEQILLGWVNYHLENSGASKRVKNFSGDVKDGEAYVLLLSELAPKKMNKDFLTQETDPVKRMTFILEVATSLGVDNVFDAESLAKGDEKINFAFVASLFNAKPGLSQVDYEEQERQKRELIEKEKQSHENSAKAKLAQDEQELQKKYQLLEERLTNRREKLKQKEEKAKKELDQAKGMFHQLMNERESEWNKEQEERRKEFEKQRDELNKRIQEYEDKKKELLAQQEELKRKEKALEEELAKKQLSAEQMLQEKQKLLEEQWKQREALLAKQFEEDFQKKLALLDEENKKKQETAKASDKPIPVLGPEETIRKLFLSIEEGSCLIRRHLIRQEDSLFEAMRATSDPYVIIKHKDKDGKTLGKWKTKVVYEDNNPVWHETVEVRNFAVDQIIELVVWDRDLRGFNDTFLGQLNIHRKDVAPNTVKWFKLGKKIGHEGILAKIRDNKTVQEAKKKADQMKAKAKEKAGKFLRKKKDHPTAEGTKPKPSFFDSFFADVPFGAIKLEFEVLFN